MNVVKEKFYCIPSLPKPSGGPYQVAIVGCQFESDVKLEATLTSIFGLKQEEGFPKNIESKLTKTSIWENACPNVKAMISLQH